MQRIPLEERLQKAGADAEAWTTNAAKLYMDTYFRTLSEMSGSRSYMEFYEDALQDAAYGGIKDTFIAMAAHESVSGIYAPEIGKELLCRLLIQPFCDKRIFNKEGEYRK